MKKRLITIGLAILLAPIWIPFILSAVFYVNQTGTTVAKIAIEKNDISHCNRIFIMPWQIFSPSTKQQRGTCIYYFAEATKNPEICELLLPNEYGLACISNIWPQMLPDDGCGWNVKDPNVYECRPRGGQLKQSANCIDFSNSTKQYSACLDDKAFRAKDISLCNDIPDALIKEYCTTRLNAWLKYPELRNSFYFGNPIPADTR